MPEFSATSQLQYISGVPVLFFKLVFQFLHLAREFLHLMAVNIFRSFRVLV